MNDTQDPGKLAQTLELLQSQLDSARADAQRSKDELTRVRADAERGNRARDEFLGVLSHELRTPLASILLHAQMLSRGEIPADKTGLAIAKIEHNAMLQTQMIDDLLEATRIVSGKFKLEARAFELSSVVRDAAESMRAAADQRGITLDLRVADSRGEVWGDPARTREVVRQLLSNAIKFTPKAGRITLKLETHERHAVLHVEDSGAGIDPEFLPHVFDRLVQRESSTTRRHGGLGLGLAIVRHVIEVLGGRVSAMSPGVGHGSTFSVTFPLAGWSSDELGTERNDVPLVRPLDRPGRRGYDELNGLRVLILDDDPTTLDAVLEVFKLSGAVVRTASSTNEALLALEDFVPQVVVSDIAMPESVHSQAARARSSARRRDACAGVDCIIERR